MSVSVKRRVRKGSTSSKEDAPPIFSIRIPVFTLDLENSDFAEFIIVRIFRLTPNRQTRLIDLK